MLRGNSLRDCVVHTHIFLLLLDNGSFKFHILEPPI